MKQHQLCNINSQLVAHPPGLTLDQLGNAEGCEVSAGNAGSASGGMFLCFLVLVPAEVSVWEDFQRTEELGSKLRTLTYEHERLQSMHRDMGANAEHEMNFKSKMAYVFSFLQKFYINRDLQCLAMITDFGSHCTQADTV